MILLPLVFPANFISTSNKAFIDGGTSRLKVNEIKIALIKADNENWNWLHKCLWHHPKVEGSDPATDNLTVSLSSKNGTTHFKKCQSNKLQVPGGRLLL